MCWSLPWALCTFYWFERLPQTRTGPKAGPFHSAPSREGLERGCEHREPQPPPLPRPRLTPGRPLTCRLVRLPRKAPRLRSRAAGRPGGSLPEWPRRASLLWRSRCPLLPCLPPSPAAEAASIAAGEGGRLRAAEAVVSIPDSAGGVRVSGDGALRLGHRPKSETRGGAVI